MRDVATRHSLCQGGGSGTDPTRGLHPVPRLFYVPFQLRLLPRTAPPARSDNGFSLSDAEGARQPQQDKKAKDIYNCVIKRLLCLPGMSLLGRWLRCQCKGSQGDRGHPALRQGHPNQDVPQTPALVPVRVPWVGPCSPLLPPDQPGTVTSVPAGPPAAQRTVAAMGTAGAGPRGLIPAASAWLGLTIHYS